MCNVEAYAINYDLGGSTNAPGVGCTGHGGKNLGDWFGINEVWFHEDIAASHRCTTCKDAVVRNATCQIPSMYRI